MKSLDAAAGIDGQYLICRQSAAAAHTDPNITQGSIHGDCMLILLDTITNEKTVKFLQLDIFTPHPDLQGPIILTMH